MNLEDLRPLPNPRFLSTEHNQHSEMVDGGGIEPPASALRTRRSPS